MSQPWAKIKCRYNPVHFKTCITLIEVPRVNNLIFYLNKRDLQKEASYGCQNKGEIRKPYNSELCIW